jgi:hypothetical protein
VAAHRVRRERVILVSRTKALLVALVAVVFSAGHADSQRRYQYVEPNAPYDGKFTFARLRYQGHPGWSFDYPAMERNFMTITNDLTTIHPHVTESNVLDMNDPELFRYPIAYLSEPGYWYPDDSEASGLRTWLQKGGFLIVDDFLLNQWAQFERAMRQVMPDAQVVPLTIDHPVFHSFFSIESLEGMNHPGTPGARAEYLGIFENNDPSQRLMVIINYNNDIGDYMEWSGEGWYPVNLSNDAYKFATNYIVYGLTR